MGSSTFPGAAVPWADISPLTTRGDLVIGSAATTTGVRVAIGSENEIITADSSGDAVWAAGSAGGYSEFVLAYQGSSVVCSTETYTPIAMDSETIDSDSMHVTTGSAAETARITFTSAGTYAVVAHAWTVGTSCNWQLYIMEGDGPTWLYRTRHIVTDGERQVLQLNALLTRTAASYISMYAWQDSGFNQEIISDITGFPNTYFGAARVG